MTKAEEILEKHLKINDVETMLGKHGRTHNAVINALNEAINYKRCCDKLPKSDIILARYLHDNYELIAKNNEWSTQESCKVDFSDLPIENKNTMNTSTKQSSNEAECGNKSKPLLAVVLIFCLITMWFSTIGLLSEICHGKYFWYRCIFIFPFTFSMLTISRLVWKHYR